MSRIQNKKNSVQYREIETAQAGRRIDNYILSQFKGLPRKRLYQMLRKGEVRVNGKRVRQAYRLEPGDRVRLPPISMPEASAGAAGPPPESLLGRVRDCVLYEDARLLALNKPAGIAVHSGSGLSYGIIELMRHLRGPGEELQLVHRLDRDTSGVLLLARDQPCLSALQACFREGRVDKQYLALLCGRMQKPVVEVDRPLQRGRLQSGERLSGVSDSGKPAQSRFELERQWQDLCLARVHIATGRTHQIRVHAAELGLPVAGDSKYGDRETNRRLRQKGLKRLFLHAARLELPAVDGPGTLRLEAPLPVELAGFLAGLG